MSLPKLMIPQFTTVIPSTEQEIQFRAFTVREEKILLIAAEAKDMKSMSIAIKQVLQNCIITPNVKVELMPFFDVEYLFLQIRAKSVGETVKPSFHHVANLNRQGVKCEVTSECEINLEQIAIPKPQKDLSIIELDASLKMQMRYPTLDEMLVVMPTETTKPDSSKAFDLLTTCFVNVFDGNTVHTPDNKREAAAFIESLSHNMTKKINHFFEKMPTVEHTLSYTCTGCGQEDTVTLKGLKDFF